MAKAGDPGAVLRREGEVADHRNDRAEHRQAEEARDLALGALGAGLVVIRHPVDVRRQTRVLELGRHLAVTGVVTLVEADDTCRVGVGEFVGGHGVRRPSVRASRPHR